MEESSFAATNGINFPPDFEIKDRTLILAHTRLTVSHLKIIEKYIQDCRNLNDNTILRFDTLKICHCDTLGVGETIKKTFFYLLFQSGQPFRKIILSFNTLSGIDARNLLYAFLQNSEQTVELETYQLIIEPDRYEFIENKNRGYGESFEAFKSAENFFSEMKKEGEFLLENYSKILKGLIEYSEKESVLSNQAHKLIEVLNTRIQAFKNLIDNHSCKVSEFNSVAKTKEENQKEIQRVISFLNGQAEPKSYAGETFTKEVKGNIETDKHLPILTTLMRSFPDDFGIYVKILNNDPHYLLLSKNSNRPNDPKTPEEKTNFQESFWVEDNLLSTIQSVIKKLEQKFSEEINQLLNPPIRMPDPKEPPNLFPGQTRLTLDHEKTTNTIRLTANFQGLKFQKKLTLIFSPLTHLEQEIKRLQEFISLQDAELKEQIQSLLSEAFSIKLDPPSKLQHATSKDCSSGYKSCSFTISEETHKNEIESHLESPLLKGKFIKLTQREDKYRLKISLRDFSALIDKLKMAINEKKHFIPQLIEIFGQKQVSAKGNYPGRVYKILIPRKNNLIQIINLINSRPDIKNKIIINRLSHTQNYKVIVAYENMELFLHYVKAEKIALDQQTLERKSSRPMMNRTKDSTTNLITRSGLTFWGCCNPVKEPPKETLESDSVPTLTMDKK